MPPLAARNPEIQTLRRLLRRRSARRESGRYVVEGPRLALEALGAGAPVQAVYVPVDAQDHPDVIGLVDACDRASVVVRVVAPGVLEHVATTDTPQPALALVTARPATIGDILPAPRERQAAPLVLVLCDVSDPGNAGTLLRIAEAAGASGVVVCGEAAVDVHNPKVVRAAAGSLFRIPVAVVDGAAASVLAELHERSIQCVATASEGGIAYDEIDWRSPAALLLGSEAHGLDRDLLDEADVVARVPMAGTVESLNVAIAGAVVAFEAARQRRIGKTTTGDEPGLPYPSGADTGRLNP